MKGDDFGFLAISFVVCFVVLNLAALIYDLGKSENGVKIQKQLELSGKSYINGTNGTIYECSKVEGE